MVGLSQSIPEHINTLIDDWRRAHKPRESMSVQNLAHSTPKVMAVMSCPRLGWTDTWGCIHEVLMPLGIGVLRHSGVFWGQGLTKLIQSCLDHGTEYIITLDYDSIFTREHVAHLYQLITENEDVDCVVPVQVRREDNTSMFTMRGTNGNLLNEVSADEFNKPLTQIATGHFGLTMFRASSFAKLEKPWFWAIPDTNGTWEAGHVDEDIYFWLNAHAAGWKVCLANGVRIGHLQAVITWPKPDFTPLFQYMSGWNQKGQPNEG